MDKVTLIVWRVRLKLLSMIVLVGGIMLALSWDIASHLVRWMGVVDECMLLLFAMSLAAVSAAALKFCAPDCRLYTRDILKKADAIPMIHGVVIYLSLVFTALSMLVGMFGVAVLVFKLIRG